MVVKILWLPLEQSMQNICWEKYFHKYAKHRKKNATWCWQWAHLVNHKYDKHYHVILDMEL